MKRAWLAVCSVALFCISADPARAHESRPLYVEVTETEPLVFSVEWKIPPSVDVRNAPEITMPEACRAPSESSRPLRATRRRVYRCDHDPAGKAIRIAYPAFNPSVSALVRITRSSGEKHSIVASPDETTVVIPQTESFASVARDYLRLGVEHILEGYDHLLFLVCLMLIAGTGRRILITITGFTIAHSITLVLSALGVVRVPVPPVEAAIALSIVFLAVEIVRGNRASLTYRYPIAVSSSFGLLHGFGFAAVLGETGLPQTEIPAALLFFNLGVEIGQLLFVGAVILLYQACVWIGKSVLDRDLSMDSLRPLVRPAAYAIGMVASFWMVQRIASFWTT